MSTLSRNGLIARFHGYGRERSKWLTGGEFERHILSASGHPLPYAGTPGIAWLLSSLSKGDGWSPVREGDNLIALQGSHANVTLEPGGQFELSGTPFASLERIWEEAAKFTNQVDDLLGPHGFRQVALGYTPFADISEISWVPKGRYSVMQRHLGRTGALAHHMMKGTCAVQASYDFSDEQDCARKVRLATAMGPLTTAMFANSPVTAGKPNGFMSFRGHIWTQTDPARTGLPTAASEFGFERWVDYLLDVPMMFRRDPAGAWLAANGQTFRQWMESSTPPADSDWELHQTSVFPEVRVKSQIEVRGADCVPLPLAMSFIALFKGLFYCDQAVQDAGQILERFTSHGTREDRFAHACREGLQGVVGERRLAAWAEELVTVAAQGLGRIAPSERAWLHPLIRSVEHGASPARTLLARLGEVATPAELMASCGMAADDEASHSIVSDQYLTRGLRAARMTERVVALSRRARSRLQDQDAADLNDEVRKARRQLKKLRRELQRVQEHALASGLDQPTLSAVRGALEPVEAELDGGVQLGEAGKVAATARHARRALRQLVAPAED